MTTIPSAAPPPTRLRHHVLRGAGWVLIWAGGTLLLYLVWLLWFTNTITNGIQQDLLDQFEGFADGEASEVLRPDDDPTLEGLADDDVVGTGEGVAVIEFSRPDTDVEPVNDRPLVVVDGTSDEALRRGPGTYAHTAGPGEEGNFVVVGHRTTYGAPFYNIDDLVAGDLVHVTAPSGERFTYRIVEGDAQVSSGTRLIAPTELWVLNRDPLGMGEGRYVTLISCHPRFSNAQRIVAFGELVP